jgi:hypothetical protein
MNPKPLVCLAVTAMVQGISVHTISVAHAAEAPESPPAKFDISVDDPRPVSKALDALSQRLQILVTYEDPQYVYSGDIRDVTREVRKDGNLQKKVLVPAGGSLDVRDIDQPLKRDSQSSASAIERILSTHNLSSGEQQFRVEQSAGRFHVVPAHLRDRSGRWIETSSILDVMIKMPAAERSAFQTLEEICAHLSKAVGLSVVVGNVPINLFSQTTVNVSANDTTARSAVERTLDATRPNLTWKLFFAPDMRMYALNIVPVRIEADAQSSADRPESQPRQGSRPAPAGGGSRITGAKPPRP